MKVIFISECNKKALKNTRRILDQFSVRKGRRVWITDITQEGLDTVQSLLKKTARKNTSIICYRVFGHSISILFFIGNTKMFNEFGDVATNVTAKNLSQKYTDEKISPLTDTIALMSKLAGLFHDFGKSSPLFQEKLLKKGSNNDQIRHEYISALFLYFIGKDTTDECFLERLIDFESRQKNLTFNWASAEKDNTGVSISVKEGIVLKKLGPIAKLLTLLCLSHHRLPVLTKELHEEKDKLEDCKRLRDDNSLKLGLRTHGYLIDEKSDSQIINPVYISCANSLYSSRVFRQALADIVYELMQKVESIRTIIEENTEMVFHLARFSLMLADHVYSSLPVTEKKSHDAHDPHYETIANTLKRKANQYLDNHSFYVSNYAYNFAMGILNLRKHLPSLKNTNNLSRASADKFSWQNKADKESSGIQQDSNKYGFFGVNVASTGTGKTLCNTKIMNALNPNNTCRFSYAIPLRALTLQTGDAIKSKLRLSTLEIGIKIGSPTVQDLYEINSKKNKKSPEQTTDNNLIGSESSDIYDDSITVLENSSSDTDIENQPKKVQGILQGKFKDDYKTIIAPILACTVDTMIGASEGIRGGKQLLGMLRLLTADLILDETDELNLQDQNAACRLAFFAGLCGSKLILSSATMQACLIQAMFLHYQKGRSQYNRAMGVIDSNKVCAGFFSEFLSKTELMEKDSFNGFYEASIKSHISCLINNQRKHQRAEFIEIESEINNDSAINAMAKTIYNSIVMLGGEHFTSDNDFYISTGLVRFAHINTLIQVSRLLLATDAPDDTCIHYCIYHSQYTIAQRACIERTIDTLTNRNDSSFSYSLENNFIKKHIFVIIASPIAEVGRDNDYDFAIIEPSSFRSIIQIAGRVQRHRKNPVQKPNIHILNQNFEALIDRDNPYSRPGYESHGNKLTCKKINKSLDKDSIDPISSAKLIGTDVINANNLISIEKNASKQYLESHYCSFLENEKIRYFGISQKYFKFRDSEKVINIKGRAAEKEKFCEFTLFADGSWWTPPYKLDIDDEPERGKNVFIFGNLSISDACSEIGKGSYPFNEVSLHVRYRKDLDKLHDIWGYSKVFGFYKIKINNSA